MVEAKAWLYTLDGTTCQHVYLERQAHAQGWTETPLIPAEALAERDALIARLRETLEWYAEPVLTYSITQIAEPRSAVHADGGKRARDTLAALKEKTDDAC